MTWLLRFIFAVFLLTPAAPQIVVWNNITGPPTNSCSAGQIAYQTNAVSYHQWYCIDSYTWLNKASGQYSFVTQNCNYYVDSVYGSDSNSGTRLVSAWQSLNKLSTVTFITNDSVCAAAGSQWEDQSFNPNSVSGLQFYAYGVGSPPDISGAQVISNVTWSLAPTCTSTYIATVTLTFGSSSGTDWVNFWENGIASQRPSPVSNCLDTASGLAYYPSSDNGPGVHSITVLVHTSDGSSPVSNGRSYEISSVETPLSLVGITGAIVANIITEKNLGIDGSTMLGQNALIWNVQVLHGSKHSLYWQSGGSCTGCVANGAYYSSASTMFIVADTNALSIGTSCINCIAELPSYESAWSGSVLIEGWGLHAVSSGNFGVVDLINFVGSGIGTCAAAGDATVSNFTNLVCNNSYTGISPASSSNGNYTGGTVNINGLTVNAGNYAIQSVAAGITVNASNVSFKSTNTGSALFYCSNTLASCTLNLTNSSIAGTPWYGIYCLATDCVIASGGSVGTGNNFGVAVISYIKTTTGTITANYDVFSPGTSANWVMAGVIYTSFSSLQSGGFELNGTAP